MSTRFPLLFVGLSLVACTQKDTTADCANTVFFADVDGDGFGDANNTATACALPDGHVLDSTDCDDTDAAASPDGVEVCDGADNDCNGTVDDGASDVQVWYPDGDGDGYGSGTPVSACEQPPGHVPDGTDCDDANPQVSPGADEVCDGIDNDCDGSIDDETAIDAATWYADADADGYGDAAGAVVTCATPSGYVEDDTDCNDADDQIYPGAAEVCDGEDSDCDGVVGEVMVPGDHGTIQAAIDTSADLICVEAGTYAENLFITAENGMALTGMGGSGAVTIDAGGRDRAILVEHSSEIEITGFTLADGAISDQQGGAGVMVAGSAEVVLRDLVSHDASCSNVCYGAVFGAIDSETVEMYDLTVYDATSAAPSGYPHVGFVGALFTDLVVEGIEVYDSIIQRENSTWGGGFGFYGDGNMTLSATDVSVHDLTLLGDNFRSTGFMVYKAANVSLAGVSVRGVSARARTDAWGPFIVIDVKGDMDGDNIEVVGNTTEVASGIAHTAGFWNNYVTGHTTYTNVLVAGNTARATHGFCGGLYESETAGTATYANVTVHGNESDISTYFYGEGAFSCFNSSLTVLNASVTGNTVGGGGTGDGDTIAGGWSDTYTQTACSWDVSYSNVYGNGVDFGDDLTDWTGQDGNLSVAPGYADVSSSDPLDWDLRIPYTSPLYDAGDPSLYDADKTSSDIGAYGGPGGDSW